MSERIYALAEKLQAVCEGELTEDVTLALGLLIGAAACCGKHLEQTMITIANVAIDQYAESREADLKEGVSLQ